MVHDFMVFLNVPFAVYFPLAYCMFLIPDALVIALSVYLAICCCVLAHLLLRVVTSLFSCYFILISIFC